MNEESREEKILKAWFSEVQGMWDTIYENWHSFNGTAKEPTQLDAFMLVILEKAIRPYHYFKQEWNEKQLLQESGKGRESGTGEQQTGELLDQKRRDAFQREGERPVVTPAHAAAQSSPASSTGHDRIRVTIIGETRAHAQWLKSYHLRWDPERKWWWGHIDSGDLGIFKTACAARKMQVGVG